MPRKTSYKRKTGDKKKRTNRRKTMKRGGNALVGAELSGSGVTTGTGGWAPFGGAGQQVQSLNGGLVTVTPGVESMRNENMQMKVGGSSLSPAKFGGQKQKQQQQQGAGVLNDIALPALLVYANNAYGSRLAKEPSVRRSSRRSSSRRR
jgi:hypothetical protein